MHLTQFLIASAVLIVVPGVDFALVTRQAIGAGRRAAISTAVGLVVGGLTHATLATVGLSALLLASARLYLMVKLAGAAYLVWLGVQTLRNARRERQAHPTPAESAPIQHASSGRAFTTGVATDLLNVKVAVFYVTFLPQFVDPGPHFTWRMSLLCLLFEGLASAWYLMYIVLIDRLHTFIARPAVRRTLSRSTGATLIGMGVKLALDKSGR